MKNTCYYPHQSASRWMTVLLVCLLSAQTQAQGYLKADGKRIVNEKGENVLLRGIGLGGWMLQEGYMLRVNGRGQQQHAIRAALDSLVGPKRTAEFYDAWLANHTRKIDIDSMKSWGFNSVRLPIHYNLFTLPVEQEPVQGQNTWIEKGFQLTDHLLAWCKANHMYLILDLHATPGGQGNDVNISDRDPTKPSLWESEGNKQKTIALWRRLAARYAGEPWIGAYDIINEPNMGFSDPVNDKNGTKEQKNEPLRKLMTEITAAIREVDKKHIIIIEGNGWGNNYNGVLPPWDNNMVLSFHKYWNKNDQASIGHILAARNQYNIPVWLGETGENSNVWFTEAIRLLESNNIGWSWWPLKKMGFNNPSQIRSNPGYEQILNYWSGKGSKPDEATAYEGIMKLAAATRLENTIYHPDVIDAMFRQPFSAENRPYKANFIGDKTVLNMADYDLGRNGIAYFDHDTADYRTDGQRVGNRGRTYRNDGVDIRMDAASAESSESYYVSDIETGEWMQYTVDVAKKGTYTLRLTAFSDTAGGKLSILSNGTTLAKEVAMPDAQGTKWQTLDISNIPLQAGKQALRVYADKGGFNLKSIQFLQSR